MDFLGIGPLELLIVVLVGLLILGPAQTIHAARNAGRIVRELQQTVGNLSDTLDDIESTSKDRSDIGQDDNPGGHRSEGER